MPKGKNQKGDGQNDEGESGATESGDSGSAGMDEDEMTPQSHIDYLNEMNAVD